MFLKSNICFGFVCLLVTGAKVPTTSGVLGLYSKVHHALFAKCWELNPEFHTSYQTLYQVSFTPSSIAFLHFDLAFLLKQDLAQ